MPCSTTIDMLAEKD